MVTFRKLAILAMMMLAALGGVALPLTSPAYAGPALCPMSRPCDPPDGPHPNPPYPPAPSINETVKLAEVTTPDDGSHFGQHQSTHATLYQVRNKTTHAVVATYLEGTTHTWNDLAFKGFHAKARIECEPDCSPGSWEYTYGVDARNILISFMWDRTDSFKESVSLSDPNNPPRSLKIYHYFAS